MMIDGYETDFLGQGLRLYAQDLLHAFCTYSGINSCIDWHLPLRLKGLGNHCWFPFDRVIERRVTFS